MCAKPDRLGGDSPASFWQNECADEFLFPSRIELAQPQITRQTDLIHKTAGFGGCEGMIPKRHNCSWHSVLVESENSCLVLAVLVISQNLGFHPGFHSSSEHIFDFYTFKNQK